MSGAVFGYCSVEFFLSFAFDGPPGLDSACGWGYSFASCVPGAVGREAANSNRTRG